MYDGPIYFNCYPHLTLALDDPNIVKALTLNIVSSGYHMEEGSKPFALIYRIYYDLTRGVHTKGTLIVRGSCREVIEQ